MHTRAKLNDTAESLLVLLTWQLRLIAEEMVTHPDYGRSLSVSPKQLRRLEADGWLHRGQVSAAMPELGGELTAWFPSMNSHADFGNLSWQLKERTQHWRPQRLRVCWSTEQTVTVFGGAGGRIRQPLQVQHDIGVAAMFFSRQAAVADKRSVWVGEDVVRRLETRLGTKIPDALLMGSDLQPRRAIEFGGSYSKKRLQSFHHYCESHRLPYEIW